MPSRLRQLVSHGTFAVVLLLNPQIEIGPVRAPLGVAEAEGSAWKKVSEKGGILVERRPYPGISFYEIRATTHSALPPERIGAAVWSERPNGKTARKYSKKRELLKSSATERIVYEQVRTPVISDRDYTVRLWRRSDGDGTFHMDFETDNARGPGEQKGMVRIQLIKGSWTVAPGKDGGSDITYVVVNDPAGSVPGWIAHGAQVDAARDLVVEILEFAAANPDLNLR